MPFTLPSQIIVQHINIPLIAVFLVIAGLSWFFSMWYEGRRDGFDEEHLLDLSFILIFFSGLVGFSLYKYIEWLKIYRPYNILLSIDNHLFVFFAVFLSGILPILLFCRIWKWSVFRMLDIYISAFSQFSFLTSAGLYFIYGIPYVFPLLIIAPIIYLLILRLRSIHFLSGLVFSVFLIFLIPYMALFYRVPGYLFFSFVLATISIINFYFRWRKNYAGTTSFGRIYKTGKTKITKKGTRTK